MRTHINIILSSFLFLGSINAMGFQQQTAQDPTFTARVEMVSLQVVVTTKEGRRITDLKKQDFEIYEDKVQQQVAGFATTDEPISLVLLLDTSGSTQLRLARIQDEAINFVNLLHPDDEVAVVSFADEVILHEDFSMNRDRNARGIKETRSGGWTHMYEAVWLAMEELLKPVEGAKALVLFTDGVDKGSRLATSKETIELSKETGATIYCVYFNTERDRQLTSPTIGGQTIPPFPPIVVNPYPTPRPGGGDSSEYQRGRIYLEEIAENSGGLVLDVLQMQDLRPAFESIARELASKYSIGYYSTNTEHDGKFRRISVKMKERGQVARTRKGYYAPGRKKK